MESMLRDNYTLASLSLEEQMAGDKLRMDLGGYLPEVALFGKQTLWAHGLPSNLMPRTVVGVGFAWNLFDGLDRERKVAQTKLAQQALAWSREDAEAVKNNLVKIRSNKYYTVDRLTHSIPYLTEGAAELLETIGRNFLDSLASKGLNPNKIIVTSVLRTQEDVKRLQKSGNVNASSNSAHNYATTIDITYSRFDKIETRLLRRYESVNTELLKSVLGEVLMELQKEGKCYVKYEKKQHCFHITSRM
jgi:hypothetical protein